MKAQDIGHLIDGKIVGGHIDHPFTNITKFIVTPCTLCEGAWRLDACDCDTNIIATLIILCPVILVCQERQL